METIAITPPYFYPDEPKLIASALESGRFSRVHIRKPEADPQELRRLLEAIPHDLRCRITLHDGLLMAGELGYGGVHLSARNSQAPEGWSGMVSVAVHSLDELDSREASYQLLSPIFPSISKPGHNPSGELADHERLARAVTSAHIPVVALGGVTPSDLPLLSSLGFAGAAMLSAAWTRPVDPRKFAFQFITHGSTVAQTVAGARMALDGGCRWIQLRMKNTTKDELLEAGSLIGPMCRRSGALFIIDDHVSLVEPLGAHGVHLGKNDMPVAEARAMLGPRRIIGSTANTLADMLNAQNAGADYIGLGPFRFTTTKKNLSPVLGLEGYRSIISEYASRKFGHMLPVVAIGGITPADIPPLASTGIGGVAVSSAILTGADPSASARQFSNIIERSIFKK